MIDDDLLKSLKLRLHAEFDDWPDFVKALQEFQEKTLIKLTITTSKKVNLDSDASNSGKKRKNIMITDLESENGRKFRHLSSSSQSKPRKFDYKYLKLTCKHYGSYRSTSKGIRPNQRTSKLECPTYIYGSYDSCKDKFVIKQMLVSCNHELKDEDVSLPKMLKHADSNSDNSTNPDAEPGKSPTKKKYVKIRNRNILKVPLESPGNLILSVINKIRCNHDYDESCQAMSLTREDLHAIHEQFQSKSKKEQDRLMIDWIGVEPVDSPSNTVQVICKLPAFDGSLIPVCWKAFSQVLRVPDKRIEDLIRTRFDDNGNQVIFCSKQEQGSESKGYTEEIENSVANILGYQKDGETEVIYCDTVDVPFTEDATEETCTQGDTNNTSDSNQEHNEFQHISSPLKNDVEAQPSISHPILSTLKPPVIKISPIDGKFCLEIDCEYQVNLNEVSITHSGKGIRICFTAK